MEDYPVLLEGELDERNDKVILLSRDSEYGEERKITAEDCGDCWLIRQWSVCTIEGKKFWDSSFSDSIAKEHIAILATH